jgi:hypothetical protein
MRKVWFIFLAIVGAWIIFGSPSTTVAEWFWPDDASPWETVDAFYYPNRNDLTFHLAGYDFQTVQACREWIFRIANQNGDPNILRGDYECGIGKIRNFGDIGVYRDTVK